MCAKTATTQASGHRPTVLSRRRAPDAFDKTAGGQIGHKGTTLTLNTANVL
jgi:hypothetical protein